MNYKIIHKYIHSDNDIKSFENEVNIYLANGWKVHNKLIVVESTYFVQTMIKE